MSGILQAVFADQRSFITVPGAPIIGTATAGNATASVTFSPPASDGGSPITGYTVTSSPGSLTGTGSNSPITVSGLTNGTSYTFTVTATNAIGTGPSSAASNSVTPVAPPAWVVKYYNTGCFPQLRPTGVYVDSSSNVYFSTESNYGVYSSTGTLSSQRGMTGWNSEISRGQRIYKDTSGNVYVAGSNASQSVGVVKFNSSGTAQWARRESASSLAAYSYTTGVIVDSSSNVYVSADVSNDVCCNGYYYATLIKYNSSGTRQWVTTYRTTNDGTNNAFNVVLDSSQNPITNGTTRSQALGRTVMYTAKFNASSGAITWQRFLYATGAGTGSAQDTKGSVAVDSSDNIYSVGTYYTSNLLYGLLAKYNTSGSIQWQQRFIVSGLVYFPQCIVVDSSANSYVAAYGGPASQNTILLKFDTSGTLQWQRRITAVTSGSNVSIQPISMSVDNTDSAVVISFNPTGSPTPTILLKYPMNGSKTGSYSVAGTTVTIDTSSNATISSGTATEAAGTMTTGAVTMNTSTSVTVTTSVSGFSTAKTNL
jgi:hypothetical protein